MTTVNFANFDFDDLVVQLQNRLKNKGAWKDVYRSGTGQMLIEFLAYVAQLVLYYIERRAQESFLPTAQLRSSVINLVGLLGYRVRRKVSAKGVLTFSLSEPATSLITIPKFTECESTKGLKYVTVEDAAILKGQTSVNVTGIQGQRIQIQFTGTGIANQEYHIDDTCVENSSDTQNPTFRVLIDGTEWSEVTSFVRSTSTDTHYRIISEMDDTITIRFGDGVNGMSPPSGSTITVDYIRSDGEKGNASSDQITTISSVIYDSEGQAVSNISVTNSVFSGGEDEEGIEEIRYEAPRVFKTGDRAVTKEDFISILESYPGVACVNVWGENEEAELQGVEAVPELLNTVKICLLLTDWQIPDETTLKAIGDYLYNKSMLTVRYSWVDPVIVNVIPVLSVVIKKGNSITNTQEEIVEVLENLFLLGETTRLGEMIKYSEVVAGIHNLDSVAYVNVTLEVKENLSDTYTSLHNWGATLEMLPIKPESVRVFFDNVYMVTDVDNHDGTGTFTYNQGGTTITGTITYETGEILLDTSVSPVSVHVRYQQDRQGNLIPRFNTICRLDESGPDFTDVRMEG